MPELKKIAVLDIGTSAVMLLLVSFNKTGEFEIINEFGGISRLGEGLRENNLLSQEAIDRTLDICKEVVNIAKTEAAEKIIITLTSSIRNAINKTEFLVKFQTSMNIFPHILTIKDEVNFIYYGALTGFSTSEKPVIVVEVGGDNTLITYGTKDMIVGTHSLDIGSFYVPAQFNKKTILPCFRSPIQKYIKRNMHDISKDIKNWLENRESVTICSGLTLTTFADIATKQVHHNRKQIDKKHFSCSELEKQVKKICRMNINARKKIPGMDPDRVSTFPRGIYIMSHILKQLDIKQFQVTSNGLRTGILKSYIEKSLFLN